jgi:hypothetical protein
MITNNNDLELLEYCLDIMVKDVDIPEVIVDIVEGILEYSNNSKQL